MNIAAIFFNLFYGSVELLVWHPALIMLRTDSPEARRNANKHECSRIINPHRCNPLRAI